VAAGIVARLNRPGGNITGFATLEASMGGKWLELLSEIAPGLKRAAIMFNPDTAPVSTYMPSFESAARSLRASRTLRTFTATQRSKRPSSPLGASQEAALSSCRMNHGRASHANHNSPAFPNIEQHQPDSAWTRKGRLWSIR
jgi:hypothetical protein